MNGQQQATQAPSDREVALGIAAGALGAIFIAFSAWFVVKSDADAIVAAVWRCAYAVPVLLVLAAREGRRVGWLSQRQIMWACVAGLAFAADLAFWHLSIFAVGTGLGTVLANTQVVLMPFAAWMFLHERITLRVGVGIPVALAGVVGVSGAIGDGAYGDAPLAGAIYGLATAVAYTIFLLAYRQAATDRPHGRVQALTIATTVSAAVDLAVGLAMGTSLAAFAPVWPGHAWLVVLAISSQVIAWLLIGRALGVLRATTVSFLLMIQPVTAMLFAAIALGETPSIAQWLGAALIMAAVVLVVSGQRGRAAH